MSQLPLVFESVLQRLLGLRGGASIYRSLARLRDAGLLATIKPPLYRGRSQELYYLTDLGLATLAIDQRCEVRDLVRHLRLSASHLRALLPQLEHLVASYDLLAALAASRGGTPSLLVWERPCRRRYWRPMYKGLVSLTVPAYATLSWDAGRPGAYFFIPDRAHVPLHHYRPLINQLFTMRRFQYEGFPILIVGTWGEERREGWTELLDAVSDVHQVGMLPAQITLWNRMGDGLEGVEKMSRMQELPREQVQRYVSYQRLVPRMVNRPIPRPVGDALAISDLPTVDTGIEPVAPRLSPGDYEMLDLIAEHPFLPLGSLPTVLEGSHAAVRRRHRRLLTMGLVRLVGSEEIGTLAAQKLSELTLEGMELVAAHRGVSLVVAVRELGLIGGGPVAPLGPRRRLLLHLPHTMGVDALFLRFYQTAQRRAAAGHDDAMLRWWNGTTCSRRHLRPDGYGLYQYEGEPHGFFLEYDRGTMRRHGYRDKLDEYYDYHISGRYQRDYSAYPTILIVTVNNHTEDTIAEVAEVTADRYGFRLPLLLTCTGRVDAPGNPHGLLGPIWRPPDGASIERRRWL